MTKKFKMLLRNKASGAIINSHHKGASGNEYEQIDNCRIIKEKIVNKNYNNCRY